MGWPINKTLAIGRFSRWTNIVLSLPVVSAGWMLGTSRSVYETSVLNVFLAFSLAGFALIYLYIRPRWGDALMLLGATGLLAVADIQVLHYGLSALGLLALAGIAGIAMIATRCVWAFGEERKKLALTFLFATLSVSSNGLAGFFHNWTAQFTPGVVDLYLYCFDASLRIQLAFLMGQAFATWPWFRDAGMLIYIGFPISLALVFAGQLMRDWKTVLSAMTAFLVTGPMGVIFYTLCPALGPVYLFTARYPWNPLTSDQASRLILETQVIPGLRNSLPSLHVAWVLLAWWYSKGLPVWGRAIVMCFLILTVISTLGSGEHYVVDLVVAWPFALFIYAVCSWFLPWTNSERAVSAAAGLGMTLAWIGVLRLAVKLFWISPAIPWTASAATIIWAELLRRRVAAAERAACCVGPAATNLAAFVSA